MLKAALAFLQLAAALVKYLERQRLIGEGERRQLARDTAAVVEAGKFADELKTEIKGMSEDELDSILSE